MSFDEIVRTISPYLGMCGFMFIFFVAYALLNLYVAKVEKENKPKLEWLLNALLILFFLISFPISCIGIFVISQYTKRHIKAADSAQIHFDAEISRKNIEIRNLTKQIEDIEFSSLQRYEDGYAAGKHDACEDLQKKLELERSYSYRSGYADGQKDYPLGINLLEDE